MKFEEILWGIFGLVMVVSAFPLFIGAMAGHGAKWVAVEKLGINYWLGVAIGWAVGLAAAYFSFALVPSGWVESGGNECYSRAPGAC